MSLLTQFRCNMSSVLIILKRSKVEASEEKIIRPCLLNKNKSINPSQGRWNHKTVRIVELGPVLGGKGGGVVSQNHLYQHQRNLPGCCKQRAGLEPRKLGPFCQTKIKRTGYSRPASFSTILEVKGGRGQVSTCFRVKPEQNRPQKADHQPGV